MTEQTYVATGFPVARWMGFHNRVLPCRDRKRAEQGILCLKKVSMSQQRIVIGTGFYIATNPFVTIVFGYDRALSAKQHSVACARKSTACARKSTACARQGTRRARQTCMVTKKKKKKRTLGTWGVTAWY